MTVLNASQRAIAAKIGLTRDQSIAALAAPDGEEGESGAIEAALASAKVRAHAAGMNALDFESTVVEGLSELFPKSGKEAVATARRKLAYAVTTQPLQKVKRSIARLERKR